jgi:uncharacterized membrane protein YoaK (UPF0700 family)
VNRPPPATPTALPTQRTLRVYALIAAPLCLVAGALNAVGFLTLAVMASHVTGTWTRIGAETGRGDFTTAWEFGRLAVFFIGGAMTSTFLVEHNLEQTRRLRYVKPLILELVTLLALAGLGWHYGPEHAPHLLGGLFAFAMGLQNATITKVSGAAVRTTHMTGITTDLGIEIARVTLLVRDYVRQKRAGNTDTSPIVHTLKGILFAETAKAAFLLCMLLSFTTGSFLGALCQGWLGILAVLPPSGLLAFLIAVEIVLYEKGRPGYYVQTATGTSRYPRNFTPLLEASAPPQTATSSTTAEPPASDPLPASNPEAKLGSSS